jgi:hypothetical protein
MPVVLTIWEVEFERIMVPAQPGQKSLLDSISTGKKLSVVVCTSHLSNDRKTKIIERSSSKPARKKKARPFLQNNQSKKDWRHGLSEEHLCSK